MTTPASATATAATIATDLARFIHRDQFTELRALHVGGPGRTFAGWFDGAHLIDLARNALAITRQAAAVYFIPNPVNPTIAAKRINTVLNVPRGFALTRDDDIIECRFLIVDIDPCRLTEGNESCPSSAHELVFSRGIAGHIRPYLRGQGHPDPIMMMSGNGIHLVYPLVPAIPGEHWRHVANPMAETLADLSARFSCLGAKIDTNTFNPCRMLKVPGTYARKGESTRSRPHRIARILEVPDEWRQPDTAPRIIATAVHIEPIEQRQSNRQVGTEARARGNSAAVQPNLFDRGADSNALH